MYKVNHQKREIAVAQAKSKSQNAIEKIVEVKLEKWFQQICLMKPIYLNDIDY